MNEYRYEVTLERIEVKRGNPDNEELERSWQVGVVDAGQPGFIRAVGLLRTVTPSGTAQAMSSVIIVPSLGDDQSITRLAFADRVGLIQRIGCDELLYDAARRSIISQGAHMDLGFDFDLKAPEYEAGRVSFPDAKDAAGNGYKLGDRLPREELGDMDCPATYNGMGASAFCVLNRGHSGQHVAAGNDLVVVEVWD